MGERGGGAAPARRVLDQEVKVEPQREARHLGGEGDVAVVKAEVRLDHVGRIGRPARLLEGAERHVARAALDVTARHREGLARRGDEDRVELAPLERAEQSAPHRATRYVVSVAAGEHVDRGDAPPAHAREGLEAVVGALGPGEYI